MSYDAHANFSYSTVATAPSPASTGLSLVVQSGDGAKFPSVPFNATVWPTGVQPLTSNAEIVRVTNIAADTLTITRATESSNARSIIVGDQIAATITKKTFTDIEAGGIGIASQAVNEIIFASSATQLARSSGFTFTSATASVSVSGITAGAVAHSIRNTAAGTGNYAGVNIGNDQSATTGQIFTPSSTYTGTEGADRLVITATPANGMSLFASNAAGSIRFYTGGTTEVGRWDSGGDFFTTTWTDYTASSTITGWSGFTGGRKFIQYKKVGKTVFVQFHLEGTSNATTASFTLPVAAANNGYQWTFSLGITEDNGTFAASGQCILAANASTVNCYKSATAAWTNVNEKIVSGQFWYQTA